VLGGEFAQRFAAIAGFRNVLAHEYLTIDWQLVYVHVQGTGDFEAFGAGVRQWLDRRSGGGGAG